MVGDCRLMEFIDEHADLFDASWDGEVAYHADVLDVVAETLEGHEHEAVRSIATGWISSKRENRRIVSAQYDARGQLWFNYVVPSSSLRELVKRHLLKQFPTLNYCCEWKDTNGFGLMLTVTAWKGTNWQGAHGVYSVPN